MHARGPAPRKSRKEGKMKKRMQYAKIYYIFDSNINGSNPQSLKPYITYNIDGSGDVYCRLLFDMLFSKNC